MAEWKDIGLPWVRMRGSSVVHRFRGSGGGGLAAGGCREDVMRALLKRFVKAYLRPNLLHMGKLVFILLFLLLLSRRSDGAAGAHATVNVLLLFLGWFQDLRKEEKEKVRN